jgi:isocitrate lyase
LSDFLPYTKCHAFALLYNFLREQYRVWWNQLKNLGVLTPGQASQMMAVKRKERKALLEMKPMGIISIIN